MFFSCHPSCSYLSFAQLLKIVSFIPSGENIACMILNSSFKILPNDLKIRSRVSSLHQRNENWIETWNYKFKAIKDSTWTWGTSYHIREDVILCRGRLRIGHTRLIPGYLITRTDPPAIAAYDEALTVQLILMKCQQFSGLWRHCRFPATIIGALGIYKTLSAVCSNAWQETN